MTGPAKLQRGVAMAQQLIERLTAQLEEERHKAEDLTAAAEAAVLRVEKVVAAVENQPSAILRNRLQEVSAEYRDIAEQAGRKKEKQEKVVKSIETSLAEAKSALRKAEEQMAVSDARVAAQEAATAEVANLQSPEQESPEDKKKGKSSPEIDALTVGMQAMPHGASSSTETSASLKTTKSGAFYSSMVSQRDINSKKKVYLAMALGNTADEAGPRKGRMVLTATESSKKKLNAEPAAVKPNPFPLERRTPGSKNKKGKKRGRKKVRV